LFEDSYKKVGARMKNGHFKNVQNLKIQNIFGKKTLYMDL